MAFQLSSGRGIDRIADAMPYFLGAGGRRCHDDPLIQATAAQQIPKNTFRHGAAANIAVAYKHDADGWILHGLPPFPLTRSATLGGIHQTGGQRNDQTDIIGLYFRLMGGLTAAKLSASFAFGDDDISLLGIGLGRYGLQLASARIGTIPRIDIHMERPQAEGAMISGGIPQGKHLPAAMRTGEAVVKF